ncbi:MAG: gamma carbonic anhydrase family protein [Intestinimonas sp.]|jgi:carbonic anhydrase/acetyltransferase-like protein (isoleucine patch superfamily)|nr:gamma carbonic anhydrase family protein [Intestinimonas sp.]
MALKKQQTHGSVVIMDGAVVAGDVTLGEDCAVWYNAVIRGDEGPIVIGDRTNVQDGAVLHSTVNGPLLRIGSDVTIGHRAIVHGCTVGSHTLIGMGAILLDGCTVGDRCLVGAGALVTGKTVVPDGHMIVGNPGRVVRALSEEEIQGLDDSAREYAALKEKHR